MSSLVEDITCQEINRGIQAGTKRRICIVTSSTVCCNPRVVKEADALSAAGYDVRVVASQHVRWATEWDEQLMKQRAWKLNSVRWDDSDNQSRNIRLRSAARQRVFKTVSPITDRWLIPERAYSRLFAEQLREATRQRADLFIAHNPQALPVAAAAAKQFGVDFAFDAEDFHAGEFQPDEQQSQQCRLLTHLESKYLPQCAYVTSPSDQISEALAQRYGISKPTTVHNVFSWSDRNTLDGKIEDRRGPALSLYWYSQVIGLDRGLQDVIRAAALLSGPIQIHVRGELSDQVRQELMQLASELGIVDFINFHQPVPPEQLLSRGCEHDVGLALEQPVNENRNLTVTNKLFHYLLAGLSIAATATHGQRAVMEQCKAAGLIYEPGDYKTLATGLQHLIVAPHLLQQRKNAALAYARDHWNWEHESRLLINLVELVLIGR